MLLPPFGNGCGYMNFLSIGPKTAEAEEEDSGAMLWVAIVAAVVIVAHRRLAHHALAQAAGDGGVEPEDLGPR